MTQTSRNPRLSIEVEPDLGRRLKVAAAERDVSVREFVLDAIRRALADQDEDLDWIRLSEPAFARDWDSEADAVYDAL